jgi:hypothetical protein
MSADITLRVVPLNRATSGTMSLAVRLRALPSKTQDTSVVLSSMALKMNVVR